MSTAQPKLDVNFEKYELDGINTLRCLLLDKAVEVTGQASEQQIAVFDLNTRLLDMRAAITEREAQIYVDVSVRPDPATGKALFTNEASRKAEAERIAAQDAVLVGMRKQARDIERDIIVKRAEAEGLSGLSSLVKAFLHGGGGS
jgi:hypothetical protein